MQKRLLDALVGVGAFALFAAGLFFTSQAYTMAFHGIYLDCFAADGSGCSLRHFSDPTLLSSLYGTALALLALGTFYLGARVIRRLKSRG